VRIFWEEDLRVCCLRASAGTPLFERGKSPRPNIAKVIDASSVDFFRPQHCQHGGCSSFPSLFFFAFLNIVAKHDGPYPSTPPLTGPSALHSFEHVVVSPCFCNHHESLPTLRRFAPGNCPAGFSPHLRISFYCPTFSGLESSSPHLYRIVPTSRIFPTYSAVIYVTEGDLFLFSRIMFSAMCSSPLPLFFFSHRPSNRLIAQPVRLFPS